MQFAISTIDAVTTTADTAAVAAVAASHPFEVFSILINYFNANGKYTSDFSNYHF